MFPGHIGEVAALVDWVEAVAPAQDASLLARIQASAELAGQVSAFENRMTAITENAKLPAVKHIARRTDEMARNSLDAQTRAMDETARVRFRADVGPDLQGLVMPLQHLANLDQRGAHPLGTAADACGDGGGGVCPRLGAGGLAVGTVSAECAAPVTAQ